VTLIGYSKVVPKPHNAEPVHLGTLSPRLPTGGVTGWPQSAALPVRSAAGPSAMMAGTNIARTAWSRGSVNSLPEFTSQGEKNISLITLWLQHCFLSFFCFDFLF
jgi:hypothetical protein